MKAAKRAVGLAALLLGYALAASGAGPNILLMMADDLGWNEVGFSGSAIKTPTVDSLAARGLRLDRNYASSLCTPTRVAIMTGRRLPDLVLGQVASRPRKARLLS